MVSRSGTRLFLRLVETSKPPGHTRLSIEATIPFFPAQSVCSTVLCIRGASR
jgi:hypothetical protein